jgi:CheY-specific phosphatase CheX
MNVEEIRTTEPGAESLRHLVVDIWTLLVGLPVELAERETLALVGRPLVVGRIEVLGQWRGHIGVLATAGLATGIAAAMFDKRPADVTEDDRCDAIGELTNVTGGNFKALLAPLESELSLPRVSSGAAPALMAGERVLGEVALSCEGQALIVTFVAGATTPGP